MDKVVALLPMKEESERVPLKNFRDLCGKPLFRHVLDTLLVCERVSRVHINTDSRRIVEMVAGYSPKVTTSERPAEICGGHVPMNDIIRNDLNNIPCEHFLQTHATNPLLTATTIDAAIGRYFAALKEGYDSLLSVTCHYSRFYTDDLRPINHQLGSLLNTQDMKPVLEENSNMYIFSKSSFNTANHRIGKKPFFFRMDELEAVDIDYEDDFVIAEAAFFARQGRTRKKQNE